MDAEAVAAAAATDCHVSKPGTRRGSGLSTVVPARSADAAPTNSYPPLAPVPPAVFDVRARTLVVLWPPVVALAAEARPRSTALVAPAAEARPRSVEIALVEAKI